MFRIGEFSRLTQVPVKTLRYYDEIGLFQPTVVDQWTGYRYYAYDQLPRLNRILALKGLGLSLEHIRQILDDALSADELRGMLRLRHAQLEQQMGEMRAMLRQVEIRIQQIEQEGNMPKIEVLTKEVAALTIASAREIVPGPELMRERCIALLQAAGDLIQAQKLKTDGISFAIYHDGEEEGIDVEMAFAVSSTAAKAQQQGEAQIRDLPPVQVAYTVYEGSYDDHDAVGHLYPAIVQWTEQSGYRIAGPAREIYLQPPQSADDPTGIMEIQYPVEEV